MLAGVLGVYQPRGAPQALPSSLRSSAHPLRTHPAHPRLIAVHPFRLSPDRARCRAYLPPRAPTHPQPVEQPLSGDGSGTRPDGMHPAPTPVGPGGRSRAGETGGAGWSRRARRRSAVIGKRRRLLQHGVYSRRVRRKVCSASLGVRERARLYDSWASGVRSSWVRRSARMAWKR
jgi:hypothetical protein